jgi:hypothetical protein
MSEIPGRLNAAISVTVDWDLLEVQSVSGDKNVVRQVLDIVPNTALISLLSRSFGE